MALGSSVNYIKTLFMADNGNNLYWLSSIKHPITPDITGTLNVFLYIGIFVWVICPLDTIDWGTVVEIKG